MHKPVLLQEVVRTLDPRPGDFMIDGTVDGGGHAVAIIKAIGALGTFLGVDWDKNMIARHTTKTHAAGKPKNEIYRHGNYADLPAILKKEKLGKADGLLVDLGFSSEQLEDSGRGFSFGEASKDEPLLMTYDDSRTPVAQVLREIDEDDLANIIFRYGGEHMSRQIAKAIKVREREHRILTVGELAETVRSAVTKSYEGGRIDAATRTFQALRIYANDELGNLETLLVSIKNIVKPGGRAAIITFHSLEDKIVKTEFQNLVKAGKAELLAKKPIEASREEIAENPRSRSAKLRAIKII